MSRHCWRLMLAVSLAHSISGDAYSRPQPHRVVVACRRPARCPSGLNATLDHRAGVAGERVADGLAGVGVPQPHRGVGAGGGQAVPVGAERHPEHRVGVAGERVADRLAGVGVPQPHRAVVAGEASRCPSGLNATPYTAPVWPVSGAPIGWPVSASHSRTVASALAEASRCPSGLNATLVHRAGVAGERGADRLAGVGVPQPHRRVVAGAGQPVPVGAERHTVTAPVWPVSGSPIGWPVSASHSRTVASSLAEASRCPSGLNATPFTAPVWPVSGAPIGWPVSASHSRTVRRRWRRPAGARRG